MRNQKRAICVICRRPVEIGGGHFVGPALVAHDNGECDKKALAVRKPGSKRLVALGNAFLMPRRTT